MIRRVLYLTTSLETLGPGPLNPVGPVAVNVKSDSSAVPPSSVVRSLTSVSFGASSSFVIVQVALPPSPIMIPAQFS